MAGGTDNLRKVAITSNQDQKEVTSNDADNELDAAITESIIVLVDDTNAATIAQADYERNCIFQLNNDSPAPTAAVTITCPAAKRGLFAIENNLSYNATVEITSQPQTSPIVQSGKHAVLFSDGVDVLLAGSDLGSLGTFLALSDTPASYPSGSKLKHVRVNSAENAVEFYPLGLSMSLTSADANISGVAGTMHVADISGFTVDRDFILPTTAELGTRIGIMIEVGDDAYELLIKTTAASNDTINGVDHDTTEWSRLFITGEVVVFTCVVADTDWIVEVDGRIACHVHIEDRSAGASRFTNATAIVPDFDTTTIDVGGMADLTNNRANIRRAGNYQISFTAKSPAVLDDTEYLEGAIRVGGTAVQEDRVYSPTADIALSTHAFKSKVLAVDAQVDATIEHNEGANLTWGSGEAVAPALTVLEVLDN